MKLCPFDLLGIEKYEMEKSAFKVWGLSLRQLSTGPEIIERNVYLNIKFEINIF